jgi:mxaJ protein
VGAFTASTALADDSAKPEVLKVCADPDNLPFSKSEGSVHGMYIDLAELVGKQLNMKVEYNWWLSYNQRKALRLTILDKSCDAYFALPADPEYKLRALARTQSFIDVSYALVSAPSFTFNNLKDLKGKRIAVLYGSPPHILLAQQEGYQTVSFLQQDEAFTALAKGDVDAALLWGPAAGYENIYGQRNKWRVTPVSGEGFNGAMSVAVQRDNPALLANIDKALHTLAPEIAKLADKYGFPKSKPTSLAQKAAQLKSGFMRVSMDTTTDSAINPSIELGRTRFNDTCSHCHGSGGISFIVERDLRRQHTRYQDKWKEVTAATIKSGRPDAGMPTWRDILTEKQIQEIISFLETIQK